MVLQSHIQLLCDDLPSVQEQKISLEDVCGINTSKSIRDQDLKMEETEFAIANSLLIPKLKITIPTL